MARPVRIDEPWATRHSGRTFDDRVMFRALTKLLRKPEPPKEPFVDLVLGHFVFDQDLGWKKQIILAGKPAELVIGSDGPAPSDAMVQTARSWVSAWPTQFPKVIEYIRAELGKW